MGYVIAVDSCTDMDAAMRADERVKLVPLTLRVGDWEVVDDERFDQADFLKRVAACPTAPSSACPSPDDYIRAYGRDNRDAYAVTLSANLSGSYNSAVLAKDLLAKDFPEKKIHVFNSRSACCGQTVIMLKIKECRAKGMSFHEVVEEVERYVSEQSTLFVLGSLEALRKNGRLTNIEAALVHVLNIKPVMMATPEGLIDQVEKCRGVKKALSRLVDHVGNHAVNQHEKIFAITHCNCLDRAKWVKEQIEKRYRFKEVIVVDAAGVASLYAADGGIVVSF